jgi:hypothetical protein
MRRWSDSSLFTDRFRLCRLTLSQAVVIFGAVGLLFARGAAIDPGHTGTAVGVYFAVVMLIAAAGCSVLFHALVQYIGLSQFTEKRPGTIFVGSSPALALVALAVVAIPELLTVVVVGYVVTMFLGAGLSKLATELLSRRVG